MQLKRERNEPKSVIELLFFLYTIVILNLIPSYFCRYLVCKWISGCFLRLFFPLNRRLLFFSLDLPVTKGQVRNVKCQLKFFFSIWNTQLGSGSGWPKDQALLLMVILVHTWLVEAVIIIFGHFLWVEMKIILFIHFYPPK